MEQPRILVLCGGKFAFPSIQLLAVENYLCGVGIGKAEPAVSRFLEEEVAKSNTPFRAYNSKASVAEMREWLDELRPDYIFSICFPYLIPEDVLAYGEQRFFNFHTGPLPSYRGPMPMFEVLRYGEKETAVCVHRMSCEFDEGAVIISELVDMDKEETFGSLAVKLSDRTSLLVQNMAQMLEYGSTVPEQQQNNTLARYFEYPEPEDTTIQWKRMPADEILNLIRACNPWNEGADAVILGETVKLISATISETIHDVIPGTILACSENQGLTLACIGNRAIDVQIVRSAQGFLTGFAYGKNLNLHIVRTLTEKEVYLPGNF